MEGIKDKSILILNKESRDKVFTLSAFVYLCECRVVCCSALSGSSSSAVAVLVRLSEPGFLAVAWINQHRKRSHL